MQLVNSVYVQFLVLKSETMKKALFFFFPQLSRRRRYEEENFILLIVTNFFNETIINIISIRNVCIRM